jgi:hypothetical protein
VRAHPVVAAGHWLRTPESGKGHATIGVDGEVSARSFTAIVLGAGMTNDSLAVADELAQARR